MLILLTALLLAAPATAEQTPPITKVKPACQQDRLRPVGGKPGAGPHTLAAEPPARQIYTVLRTEDGCTRPVPVNERVIGTLPRR